MLRESFNPLAMAQAQLHAWSRRCSHPATRCTPSDARDYKQIVRKVQAAAAGIWRQAGVTCGECLLWVIEQTSRHVRVMSAFPPKADIRQRIEHALCHKRTWAQLKNDLLNYMR